MEILQRHLVRRYVESTAQPVAQTAHDHAFVLEGLGVRNVDFEKRDRYDHLRSAAACCRFDIAEGGGKPPHSKGYANAGSSFSTLNASMTSPILMSWKRSMPIPHS